MEDTTNDLFSAPLTTDRVVQHGTPDESRTRLDTESRPAVPILRGRRKNGYELYEQDGDFVLTVELPGFERESIDVNWFEGRLNVSAERTDEERNRRRTYHRTFRMPKEIEPDDVEAEYTNGVPEARLLDTEGAAPRGTTIEVQ